MNTSCTIFAASMSRDAATQPVGMCRPTSSAWEGPDSTATRPFPSSSCSMTWLMHSAVSLSMPLATDTTTASQPSMGAIFRAVSRTAKEGVAITTSSLSPTLSRLLEISSASGRATPLSREFSLVCRRCSASSSRWDQRVTALPLSTSSRARAVPQPPLPSTVTFTIKRLLSYSCFLCRWNLFSVPVSSRLMLARCIHSTSALLKMATIKIYIS